MNRLDTLLARSEIEEVLFRYARAVDRRDWQSLAPCFHPDATDRHGDFTGSPQEFIDWVTARHAEVPFSMHFLGNCLIEFLSDARAAVETYFLAIQRREPGPGAETVAMDYEVFGRYCDLFENRGNGWRIASREVVYDGTRTQPSTHHKRPLSGVIGRRDMQDSVFRPEMRSIT
jgi:3-phenylpropionate/cinnamic acid dioxygenase small subunit